MAHKEYNVGYRDDEGRVRLAYSTPTLTVTQANKRLAKLSQRGGFDDLVFNEETGHVAGKVKRPVFLIHREISDWKVGDL
jgi:hypothetical protein